MRICEEMGEKDGEGGGGEEEEEEEGWKVNGIEFYIS